MAFKLFNVIEHSDQETYSHLLIRNGLLSAKYGLWKLKKIRIRNSHLKVNKG